MVNILNLRCILNTDQNINSQLKDEIINIYLKSFN
jgi:hypothetical protein